MRLVARMLPDGRRLHLSDGPIDLVIEAWGPGAARRAAYAAAVACASGLLDALCGELALLRLPMRGSPARDVMARGVVARRMQAAVLPYAVGRFITPMAAVAGSVAEEVLGAMAAAAPLDRAYVNNGGDIALHLAPGQSLAAGIAMPGAAHLLGRAVLAAGDGVRGIATSGWRGRSHSLGIADAVTVLAASASRADAAATVIANAVDLPDHPAIARRAASALDPDSDLGSRPVTVDVGALSGAEVATALQAGRVMADRLVRDGLIIGAALWLADAFVLAGALPVAALSVGAAPVGAGPVEAGPVSA